MGVYGVFVNIRCLHAAKLENHLDIQFAPGTMLRHPPAVDLINSIYQLPYSVLVRAVCPDKPCYSTAIPPAAVDSRSDNPKNKLGTDERQCIVPDVRFVAYKAGLRL